VYNISNKIFDEFIYHTKVTFGLGFKLLCHKFQQLFAYLDMNLKALSKFLKFVKNDACQNLMRIRSKYQLFYFMYVGDLFIVSLQRIYAIADPNQRKFEFFMAEERQKVGCVVILIAIESSLYLLNVNYRRFLVSIVDELSNYLLS